MILIFALSTTLGALPETRFRLATFLLKKINQNDVEIYARPNMYRNNGSTVYLK